MTEKAYITKSFGLELKSLRKQKGLSQGKLANKLGVHPTYISSLERGLRNPSLKVIDRIASALEINRENPSQYRRLARCKRMLQKLFNLCA